METENAGHDLMVAGGLVRVDDGTEDLPVHQGAEIERRLAAAGPDRCAAQGHEAVRQRMAAEREGKIEALPA